MGVMDWYLGVRYTRDPTTGILTLHQSKYASDILAKFNALYKISACYNTLLWMKPLNFLIGWKAIKIMMTLCLLKEKNILSLSL